MTTTEAAPLSISSPDRSTPTAPAVTPPAHPSASPSGLLGAGLLGRARARARAHGVTGPVAVAAAALVTGVGVAVDVPGDPSLGAGTGVAVVLAALVATVATPLRSLATAVVLPPLLVAAAALGLAALGGQDDGSRELALDVGTTLALSAPLIFGATATGLLVALARVGRHVSRR